MRAERRADRGRDPLERVIRRSRAAMALEAFARAFWPLGSALAALWSALAFGIAEMATRGQLLVGLALAALVLGVERGRTALGVAEARTVELAVAARGAVVAVVRTGRALVTVEPARRAVVTTRRAVVATRRAVVATRGTVVTDVRTRGTVVAVVPTRGTVVAVVRTRRALVAARGRALSPMIPLVVEAVPRGRHEEQLACGRCVDENLIWPSGGRRQRDLWNAGARWAIRSRTCCSR